MNPDITEIGLFIQQCSPSDFLLKMSDRDWNSWTHNQTTKAFFDYLIVKRIDTQNAMSDINLSSKENEANFSQLKGRFDELGDIVNSINFLLGGDIDEEGIESDR